MTGFVARPAHNPRNGHFYSLRLVSETNSNGFEFGRVRKEKDGWGAWGDDEDMGRLLRAAVYRAGRHCELSVLLSVIKAAYLEHEREEREYRARQHA